MVGAWNPKVGDAEGHFGDDLHRPDDQINSVKDNSMQNVMHWADTRSTDCIGLRVQQRLNCDVREKQTQRNQMPNKGVPKV